MLSTRDKHAHDAPSEVIATGQLAKLGQKLKTWHIRRFLLSGKYLGQFDKLGFPKGQFDISGCSVQDLSEEEAAEVSARNAFAIVGPKKYLLLCASNKYNKYAWIKIIECQIANLLINNLQQFLHRQEKVIGDGIVRKKNMLGKAHNVRLVITNLPRCLMIDPSTDMLKEQIAWDDKDPPMIDVVDTDHFRMCFPFKMYKFKDALNHGAYWQDALAKVPTADKYRAMKPFDVNFPHDFDECSVDMKLKKYDIGYIRKDESRHGSEATTNPMIPAKGPTALVGNAFSGNKSSLMPPRRGSKMKPASMDSNDEIGDNGNGRGRMGLLQRLTSRKVDLILSMDDEDDDDDDDEGETTRGNIFFNDWEEEIERQARPLTMCSSDLKLFIDDVDEDAQERLRGSSSGPEVSERSCTPDSQRATLHAVDNTALFRNTSTDSEMAALPSRSIQMEGEKTVSGAEFYMEAKNNIQGVITALDDQLALGDSTSSDELDPAQNESSTRMDVETSANAGKAVDGAAKNGVGVSLFVAAKLSSEAKKAKSSVETRKRNSMRFLKSNAQILSDNLEALFTLCQTDPAKKAAAIDAMSALAGESSALLGSLVGSLQQDADNELDRNTKSNTNAKDASNGCSEPAEISGVQNGNKRSPKESSKKAKFAEVLTDSDNGGNLFERASIEEKNNSYVGRACNRESIKALRERTLSNSSESGGRASFVDTMVHKFDIVSDTFEYMSETLLETMGDTSFADEVSRGSDELSEVPMRARSASRISRDAIMTTKKTLAAISDMVELIQANLLLPCEHGLDSLIEMTAEEAEALQFRVDEVSTLSHHIALLVTNLLKQTEDVTKEHLVDIVTGELLKIKQCCEVELDALSDDALYEFPAVCASGRPQMTEENIHVRSAVRKKLAFVSLLGQVSGTVP